MNEIYLDGLVKEGKLKSEDRALIRKYSGKYAMKPRNDEEIAEQETSRRLLEGAEKLFREEKARRDKLRMKYEELKDMDAFIMKKTAENYDTYMNKVGVVKKEDKSKINISLVEQKAKIRMRKRQVA